jgi:hypothetical protein
MNRFYRLTVFHEVEQHLLDLVGSLTFSKVYPSEQSGGTWLSSRDLLYESI